MSSVVAIMSWLCLACLGPVTSPPPQIAFHPLGFSTELDLRKAWRLQSACTSDMKTGFQRWKAEAASPVKATLRTGTASLLPPPVSDSCDRTCPD